MSNNQIILGDSLWMETYNEINCKNFIIDPPFEYYKNKFKMPFGYKKAIVFTAPNRIRDTLTCCGIPEYILAWDCKSKNYIGRTRPLQQIKFALLYGDMKTYDNRKMRTSKKVSYKNEKKPFSGEIMPIKDPHIYLSDLFEFSISKCKNYKKPYEWCRILVKNFIDDAFIDLFMGTGTFLEVAMDLGLDSWHIDIDEEKIKNANKNR